MNKLRFTGIGLLTFVFSKSTLLAQQPNTLPNIVFLLADDLGWADLSCYGNRFNESPNIDRLAESGIRFTDAYSGAPVSTPGRAAIMTGQYPARLGINDFIPGHWRPYEEVIVPQNKTQFLPTEKMTIAEILKEAGYSTGYFGKWHLGGKYEYHPINQGFDVANVGEGYYNVQYNPARQTAGNKISAEQLADFGIDFIEHHKQAPFLLFISYFDVHVPYDAKQELIDKYLKKQKTEGYPCNVLYAACVEQMDQSIGRITDKLKKEHLLENTLIVFVSDNGGSISENKYPQIVEAKYPVIHKDKRSVYSSNDPLQYIGTSNAPLRNEKGSVYEGGIRVPMIVSWQGKINTANCATPVSGVDFFPTFADIAGVSSAFEQPVDGISIMPLFFKQKIKRDYLYWHYPVYHHDVPAAAIRNNDWKLVLNLVDRTSRLYNLKSDIAETTDLSQVYPEKAKELLAALEAWQKDMNAELPMVNKDFDKNKRMLWGTHPFNQKQVVNNE